MGAPPQWRLFFPCRQQPVQRPLDEQVHVLEPCIYEDFLGTTYLAECNKIVYNDKIEIARLRIDYAHIRNVFESEINDNVQELYVWTRVLEKVVPKVVCEYSEWTGNIPWKIYYSDRCGTVTGIALPLNLILNIDDSIVTRPSARVNVTLQDGTSIDVGATHIDIHPAAQGYDIYIWVARTINNISYKPTIYGERLYNNTVYKSLYSIQQFQLQIILPPLSYISITPRVNINIVGLTDTNVQRGNVYSVYAEYHGYHQVTYIHTAVARFSAPNGLIGLVGLSHFKLFEIGFIREKNRLHYFIVNFSNETKVLDVRIEPCVSSICYDALAPYFCPPQFMVPPNVEVCPNCDLTLYCYGGGGGGFV